MKKLLVLVALLALAAIPTLAQGPITGPYLVDYYANNAAAGADGTIRLVNFGAAGNPMTTPTGDVCANIYVFDANQEMVACCSCRITPNGLLTLSVRNDLTFNVLTRIFPTNGDVKIVSTAAVGNTLCTPVTYNGGLLDSVVGFGAHVQVTAGAAYITETNIPAAALSTSEQGFLTQTCQFARYLGSGFGTCNCPRVTP